MKEQGVEKLGGRVVREKDQRVKESRIGSNIRPASLSDELGTLAVPAIASVNTSQCMYTLQVQRETCNADQTEVHLREASPFN